MKQHLTMACVALLALTVSILAANPKANFSGTWVMDRSRTEGLPTDIEQTMTITQSEDTLDIVTKVSGDQVDQTVPVTYVLNGKETEFKATRKGEGKGKRVASWSADGNGFEVTEQETYASDKGSDTFQFVRKWTMLPDGNTLVIVMDIKGPNGDATIKRTFVKK
jgi:hypothetical protein